MKDERTPYVLRFDGRIPAVRYYKDREAGVKARKKYRAEGYHVLLHKVQIPQENTIGTIDTAAKPTRRDHNSFLNRIADRFRRRGRKHAN